MPTTGAAGTMPVVSVDPKKPASPKRDTAPSSWTTRSPPLSGVMAIPTTAVGAGAPRREATLQISGVAEGEHPAVHAHEQIALARGAGGDAQDGRGRRDVESLERSVVSGVAEGEHPAVGADEPVAPAVRGGRHPDDGGGEFLGRDAGTWPKSQRRHR